MQMHKCIEFVIRSFTASNTVVEAGFNVLTESGPKRTNITPILNRASTVENRSFKDRWRRSAVHYFVSSLGKGLLR